MKYLTDHSRQCLEEQERLGRRRSKLERSKEESTRPRGKTAPKYLLYDGFGAFGLFPSLTLSSRVLVGIKANRSVRSSNAHLTWGSLHSSSLSAPLYMIHGGLTMPGTYID